MSHPPLPLLPPGWECPGSPTFWLWLRCRCSRRRRRRARRVTPFILVWTAFSVWPCAIWFRPFPVQTLLANIGCFVDCHLSSNVFTGSTPFIGFLAPSRLAAGAYCGPRRLSTTVRARVHLSSVWERAHLVGVWADILRWSKVAEAAAFLRLLTRRSSRKVSRVEQICTDRSGRGIDLSWQICLLNVQGTHIYISG